MKSIDPAAQLRNLGLIDWIVVPTVEASDYILFLLVVRKPILDGYSAHL